MTLHNNTTRALAALAGLMWPALSCAQGGRMPETTITVRPQQARGPISPSIYGTNHRYNNNATGTWDAANKRMLPTFDRVHREAGLKSIRYPGGTVASTFEWKHAIGPVEARRPIQPAQGASRPGGAGPQIVTWGVDEAARWCEDNGIEMIYLYGIGAPNSNAQDAADLVEYLTAPLGSNPRGAIDWAKVRADNGHPAPYKIRSFEIGNESDGPNPQQRFWLNALDTDANRAKRSLPFQPQRDSYAPEYCFGGVIAYEKQGVTLRDDLRPDAAKSNGQPHQQKFIRYWPIVPGSETVFVGEQAWQRVPDIKTARGHTYQVDASSGTLLFGDGANADIPPQDAAITVSYRAPRHGFVDYYAAMKAVNPNIKIYAGYESQYIIRTLGATHPYDGIVVHPYTNQHNIPKPATLNEWHHFLMLSSARVGREIETYQKLIDKSVAPDRRGQVRVICTEYGVIGQSELVPNGGAQGSYRFLNIGLYNGLQLLHWMRLGVPHAQRHSTTVDVFGPPPDFEPSPSALMYRVFTHHFGDRLIGIDLQNNPTRDMGVVETGTPFHGGIGRAGAPNAPKDAARLLLPKLEAEAARDAAGNVYLLVVNQDATDAVTANIQIAGMAARGALEAWTLGGPTATAFNTPQNPNAVKITISTLPPGDGPLRHTFPAHSLTALKFPVGAATTP